MMRMFQEKILIEDERKIVGIGDRDTTDLIQMKVASNIRSCVVNIDLICALNDIITARQQIVSLAHCQDR